MSTEPRKSLWGLLRGRANRREYWLMIGTITALSVALGFVAPQVSSGAGIGVVLYAQIRRLHDIGRTGWWAGLILVLQMAIAFGLLAAGLSQETMLLASTLLTVLIPIVVLGALPGQPNENRFGPPPGRRGLADIFS